jgi:hypothetical protein
MAVDDMGESVSDWESRPVTDLETIVVNHRA